MLFIFIWDDDRAGVFYGKRISEVAKLRQLSDGIVVAEYAAQVSNFEAICQN